MNEAEFSRTNLYSRHGEFCNGSMLPRDLASPPGPGTTSPLDLDSQSESEDPSPRDPVLTGDESSMDPESNKAAIAEKKSLRYNNNLTITY